MFLGGKNAAGSQLSGPSSHSECVPYIPPTRLALYDQLLQTAKEYSTRSSICVGLHRQPFTGAVWLPLARNSKRGSSSLPMALVLQPIPFPEARNRELGEMDLTQIPRETHPKVRKPVLSCMCRNSLFGHVPLESLELSLWISLIGSVPLDLSYWNSPIAILALELSLAIGALDMFPLHFPNRLQHFEVSQQNCSWNCPFGTPIGILPLQFSFSHWNVSSQYLLRISFWTFSFGICPLYFFHWISPDELIPEEFPVCFFPF